MVMIKEPLFFTTPTILAAPSENGKKSHPQQIQVVVEPNEPKRFDTVTAAMISAQQKQLCIIIPKIPEQANIFITTKNNNIYTFPTLKLIENSLLAKIFFESQYPDLLEAKESKTALYVREGLLQEHFQKVINDFCITFLDKKNTTYPINDSVLLSINVYISNQNFNNLKQEDIIPLYLLANYLDMP